MTNVKNGKMTNKQEKYRNWEIYKLTSWKNNES